MWHAFIVDDDSFAAEATYMMFPWKKIGITRVDKIYTTTGLVERILTETPDIVFIDIEMGDVSGLDIIARCKEHNSKALFVIVSGHDNFNYAYTAVNLGAIHYMLKPIDSKEVETLSKKLLKFLGEKYDSILSGKNPPPLMDDSPLTDLWDKLISYIERNYDKKLQSQDVCSEFFISKRTLYNIFMTNTGETFTDYLTRLRIEKAKNMLVTTVLPISDIADKVGIKDPYYFNKIFKKHTGVSPLQYRIKGGINDDAQ